jgi:hypothetical protein
MPNPRVQMFAEITSPRARITVGSDRRVTVQVDAWGVIATGGPGSGHGHIGDGILDPPRPPGNTGNISAQSGGREVEAGRVQVRLGSGSFRDATKVPSSHLPRRWRFTGTAPGSGSMEIAVRAHPPQAFQGQTAVATRTINVVVDNRPPNITIDNLPRLPRVHEVEIASGSRIDFTISGSARDNETSVRSVHAGVGEASEPAENVSGDWSQWRHKLSLRGFGRHDIRVRAVDRVGNQRQERRRVETVDTGPPRLTISSPRRGSAIAWPDEGELTVTFRGRATDDGSGVRLVTWRVGDEGRFERAEDRSPRGNWSRWRARVPIPSLGEHVVHFRCRDRAGNEVQESFSVNATDQTPPEVQITEPPTSPHEVIEQDGGVTVEVRGTAVDPVTEVAAVEWSLDGSDKKEAEPLENDWSEWAFSVHLDRPGNQTVQIEATDVSGNTSDPHELVIQVRERI